MKIVLDGKQMTSRWKAQRYLAEMLALPDYYGKNLDALYDCLTEGGEMEVEFIHLEDMQNALGSYGEKLLRVFCDTENVHVTVKQEKGETAL